MLQEVCVLILRDSCVVIKSRLLGIRDGTLARLVAIRSIFISLIWKHVKTESSETLIGGVRIKMVFARIRWCVLGTEQRVQGPDVGFCETAYELSGGIKSCGQLSVFHDGLVCCLNVFFFFTVCNKQHSMNTRACVVKYSKRACEFCV
jgi:hypothetical protein